MAPIKLIHIADLHAGKNNDRRLNRNEDLRHALKHILSFAKEHRPDYVVVAGDIFDKKVPDAESIEVISEFFIGLSRLEAKVIVIGGNHDSALFLRSQRLWAEHFGIHIFPSVDRKNLVLRDGDIAFVCVPFVSERGITDLEGGKDRAVISYSEAMKKLLHYGASLVEDVPYRVLVGHLFFAGVRLGNTEVEVTVSDTYALPQQAIPPQFTYVALGHVHRYQRLEYAPTDAYYTGSLYQLDFGEAGQRKYFNWVVLENRRAKVEKVELPLLREFKKLLLKRGDDPKILQREKRANTYYWVDIEADTPQEFLLKKQRVERIFGEQLLRVYPIFPQRGWGKEEKTQRVDRDRLKDPVEMYKEFLKSEGRKWDKEVERLLRELLQELS